MLSDVFEDRTAVRFRSRAGSSSQARMSASSGIVSDLHGLTGTGVESAAGGWLCRGAHAPICVSSEETLPPSYQLSSKKIRWEKMPDSASERRSMVMNATKLRKTETKSRRRGVVIRAFWAPTACMGGLEVCGILWNSALALSRVGCCTSRYVERKSVV